MKNRKVHRLTTTERREGVLGDWRELYSSQRGLWVVIERKDGVIFSRAYRTEAAAREDFRRPLFADEMEEHAC